MSDVRLHETLDVVLFAVGGRRVGFEASAIRGARPADSAAPSADEAIEARLGLPTAGQRPHAPQWLSLKRADQDILVDGPVELISLSVAEIHPLPPLLAARTQLHGLRALVLQAEAVEVALLFDAEQLKPA